MKYRSVIIAIATALSISALTRIESAAQTVIAGSMFGRTSYRLKAEVADSTNNEPISFASIYMRHIKDTIITNFSLTGPDGKCEINDVTRGDYDVFVEFMGYSKFHRQLYISKDIDLGKILLKPDLEALKAARVSANVNAMEIRKDTIIYNAAAFRTMPTDKLKDLLKQMPGVEVDGSGNVKVNGKTVSQITLNGKTFFLGDKTAALNNLPASVVNKVKVVDKESETAEFTGIKDDKKKTVMDVELKDEYKKGVFGNISAGAGTSIPGKQREEYKEYKKFLFNTGAFMSAYGKKDQLTILGSGLNIVGANDGVIVTSGNEEYGKKLEGGGMHTTWRGGANLNTDRIKKMETSVSATFTSDQVNKRSRTDRITYLDEGNLEDNDTKTLTGDVQKFSAVMEIKNKSKKKYNFKFTPAFTYNDYSDHGNGVTENTLDGVSQSRNISSSAEKERTLFTKGDVTFGVKDIGKKGRSVTVSGSYTYGSLDGNSSESTNTTYLDGSTVSRDLLYDNEGTRYSYGGSFKYVEPIVKHWAAEAFVSSYYKVQTSTSDAFNAADNSSNEYYSSLSENYYITNYGRLLVQYNNKSTNLQAGGFVRVINNENHGRSYGLDTHTGKGEWATAWSPFLKLTTTIKNNFILFKYDMNSERPTPSSITPAARILNPLRISAGNIYLKPSFTHDLYLTADGDFKRWNYYIYMDGEYSKDAKSNASWFDKNSVRYSIPVNSRKGGGNIQGYYNAYINLTKNKKLALSTTLSFIYSKSVSYQSTGRLDLMDIDHFDYPTFMKAFWGDNASGDLFYSGKSGFKESTMTGVEANGEIGLRYRAIDNLTMSLISATTLDRSKYSLDQNANMNVWEFRQYGAVAWNTPIGIDMVTRLIWTSRRGYAKGYNDDTWDWSLILSKSVKSFNFALEVQDILDNDRSMSHTFRENYVQDSYTNVMGRNILLRVTWNFGKMNSSRSRAARNAMWKLSY